MLRTFAATLLATSMVFGAALAAEPASPAGNPPSTAAATNHAVAMPTHPAKHTKHVRTHERKHLALAKHRSFKSVHHVKGKTHKSHVAKTMKRTKLSKSVRSAGVKTAKLPVAQHSGTN
jgi:hypothetical protein